MPTRTDHKPKPDFPLDSARKQQVLAPLGEAARLKEIAAALKRWGEAGSLRMVYGPRGKPSKRFLRAQDEAMAAVCGNLRLLKESWDRFGLAEHIQTPFRRLDSITSEFLRGDRGVIYSFEPLWQALTQATLFGHVVRDEEAPRGLALKLVEEPDGGFPFPWHWAPGVFAVSWTKGDLTFLDELGRWAEAWQREPKDVAAEDVPGLFGYSMRETLVWECICENRGRPSTYADIQDAKRVGFGTISEALKRFDADGVIERVEGGSGVRMARRFFQKK